MPTRPPSPHTQLAQSAVRIFTANELLNQILIEHLDPAAWTAKPPGNVRTIAAIFTHMHNVRAKWIRLTAPYLKVPAQLNRAHCTSQQARKALAESAARCAQMLSAMLDQAPQHSEAGREVRITQFVRDGWARPWPAGPEVLCYMVAHEAHHRGQVAMLAHQLGFPLSKEFTSAMWNWEKLWKQK